LNLWQAQNIWYETYRTSGSVRNALEPEHRSRWETDFGELGRCLSIDIDSISVEEEARAKAVAAD
jgi:hypothetical protein